MGGSRHRKAEIELRLHIKGVAYEYGKLCEFCESGPATKFCPDEICGFMCDSCDIYRHESGGNKTVEYADHARAQVSKLDIQSAAFKVKGFMRFIYYRSRMREEIRRQYSRFFNGRTRQHYYVFHRTREATWTKPRLLGKEELRPFLTPDGAAFKIQQLYRNWKAREVARDAMRREWSRVYSPQENRFFFYYSGRSPLILPTTSRWIQPCRSIGGIWVWRPVLSKDLAALRIQNMWRSFMGRKQLRRLARHMYTMEHDPITGEELYRSIQTGNVSSRKPLILGSERWDPDDMLQWNVDEVVMFARRCGLKRYTPRIRQFKIDGALLMTFDPRDYRLLGMKNAVHVKKRMCRLVNNVQRGLSRIHVGLVRPQILINIERRPAFTGYNERSRDLLRRTALRRRFFEEAQAEIIQRWWRAVRTVLLRRVWEQTRKIVVAQEEREQKRKQSERWWTDTIVDYSGLDSDIKMFGRRGNVLGVRGWGRWDPRGKQWTAAPEGVGAPHISRAMYRDTGEKWVVPVYTLDDDQLEGKQHQSKRSTDRRGPEPLR